MNTPPPEARERPGAAALELALKTLWGASRWPGQPDSGAVVEYPVWSDTRRRLDQLAGVRASGVLWGPHGVGKSYLLHRWSEALPPKHYRLLRLAHSSLMGSDLLRTLAALGGKTALYRRGDNVRQLAALWQEWAPAWPVLVIEEAQDLNTAALEELRLLTCARADAQPPFSLILCGDEDLLPRLHLGVNRALLSRLSFCLPLPCWNTQALRDYLQARLHEAGLHVSPLEPAAETLLVQSAGGLPRALNHLLQRAFESAALASRRTLTTADVQAALDTMPWLARLSGSDTAP
jgi:type II secretory pathway predicted ATPase ExeA